MSVSVKDLHVQLGSNHVLKGMDFDIKSGQRVALVGPNGCGKSTLLRTLCTILKPSQGEVRLEGELIQSYSRRERARKIGLLSQSDVIPMMTTVRDHVSIGRHPHRSYFRDRSSNDAAFIDAAIEVCEISHLADRPVERLSGGERQRVRLATLLAQSPDLLLLDEPLTGLDLEHQYALLHLLEDLSQKEGRTLMVVLHDLSLAMRFFDRLLVIHEGKLVADGLPADVMTSELLSEVFNIQADIGHEPATGQPVIICHRQG
ncbi:MAG: cobalamin/Fe(3+)-siderophore ABC transporter ATP-binding protein [Phycisphaerae bacterium]|nr:cobalamin/Fe(3+)-siderophore ABC transporter ATP-binding protein [Phycisphaerae bacterium]